MCSLPKFSFKVEIGNLGEIFFKEVSGVYADTEEIEYRQGNTPVLSGGKMPSMHKTGNIHLKMGVFIKNDQLANWFESFNKNIIQRDLVTISLLNEVGNPVRVWKLEKAWPTKISDMSLTSDSKEMRVEQIDFGHEGLTVEKDQ